MFQFFKKKSAPKREMAAVADGQVVPMNEATDPVFSSCALGGGVVIHPEGELIVAPDDGTITATMDGSNHAIGLELQSGVEVLIHIGVDTVQLNGEGFEIFVKNGDKVRKGDQLIHFDRKAMEDKGILHGSHADCHGWRADSRHKLSDRNCCKSRRNDYRDL